MTRPMVLATCELDRPTLDGLAGRFDIEYAITANRRRSLADQGIDRALAEARVLVAEVDSVDKATLAAAPRLDLVISCRASPVNVDLAACAARGVPVCTTPGRNADTTADLTFALILDACRNVTAASMWLRAGQWSAIDSNEPYRIFKGPTLRGRTLGIVGGGAVGRRVARRALGFDMSVLIHDPYLTDTGAPPGATLATLEELLSASDIVSIHVPLTATTIGLIDARRIALMNRGSYLVNASRAAVVDENALITALSSGQLAGAGLDVFNEEPPPTDHPLLAMENVVLTPHIGGASRDVIAAQTEMVAEILTAHSTGGDLPYRARNDLLDFRAVEASGN
ncbi:D-3-phosphoglycerate dehydrogenase [Tamaricihabitans halophyticus]|uniref:D-3-phosphoglycerate dehydrogenase n=1 Tax=Tamaricihabitans halophyticus TaxID=1262583 RepID=A0A4R2QLH1_9PSEU|nr:NAD(P)-dependent oxidoreductase [Tamaricihabitans halophyticus]TCP47845.1 D-3-phosphoglycerate dehydrogenase [Tamaricihabitans halophyticus]